CCRTALPGRDGEFCRGFGTGEDVAGEIESTQAVIATASRHAGNEGVTFSSRTTNEEDLVELLAIDVRALHARSGDVTGELQRGDGQLRFVLEIRRHGGTGVVDQRFTRPWPEVEVDLDPVLRIEHERAAAVIERVPAEGQANHSF